MQNSSARLVVVIVVIVCGVAAAITAYGVSSRRPAMTQADAPAPAPVQLVEPSRLPDPPAGPRFDIVRVARDGGVVLAGQATAGSTVTVRADSRVLGEVRVDERGAWVIVPDAKLPPGASELTLTATGADGRSSAADAPVLVVTPAHASPDTEPRALALLTPSSQPSRVLQSPAGRSTGHALALDTVDYDDHGAIRFSGSAPPDAPVRVYVDNGPVGDALAGDDGHWAMAPVAAVAPGVHTLRVDQLTPQGAVSGRVETPFQRETPAASQVAAGQVVVQPGATLWRLARQSYGSGMRYTVIFLANRDRIRSANLIYPGQVFSLPGAALAAR